MRHIMLLIVLIAGGTLAVRAQNTSEGLIAFAADLDGRDNVDIYVIDASGGTPRRLTTSPDVDTLPAWSPDGERILYQSQVAGLFDLFVMDKDGGGIVNLTNTPEHNERGGQWSPDGTQIAFAADPVTIGAHDIYVMSADGGEARQLTTDEANDTNAVWSPDGTQIAFLRSNRITLVSLETLEETDLGIDDAANLAWSPGAHIAYNDQTSMANGAGRLAYYDIDAGMPVELGFTAENDQTGEWSADGRLLFARVDLDSFDVMLLMMGDPRTDTSAEVIRLRTPVDMTYPDWQPSPAD